jgi:hypothetical protein
VSSHRPVTSLAMRCPDRCQALSRLTCAAAGPTVSAADLDKYDGQTARCDQFQHCSNAATDYLRRMSIAGKTPVKADRQLTADGKLVGGHQPIHPW